MMRMKKTLVRHHSFSISSSSIKTGILIHVTLILLQLATGHARMLVKELKVPRPGVIGRPATLECDWETKDMELYSTRWFKNGEQFYSFIEGNNPEKVIHGLVGLEVDLDLSDDRKVTIMEVTADTEGEYRCEIMSEAPLFEVEFLQTDFAVVKMPDTPEILGLKPLYEEFVDDFLNVTCIARHANPPASIRFLINGEPVDLHSNMVKDMDVSLEDEGNSHHPKGSYTTGALLSMPLSSRLAGNIQLTCIASVQGVEVKAVSSTEMEPSGDSNILPVIFLIGLLTSISLIIQSLW